MYNFLIISGYSLKNPLLESTGVLDDTFGEPELNLLLGALNGVGAMADVAANREAEVTTDGADGGLQRVGSTEHDAASLNSIETLPDHRNNRARRHVFDQAREKGLALEVRIVVLEMLLRRLNELEGNQLEASLLEPLCDLSNEAPLDAIRLDHDISALGGRHGWYE